VPLIAGAKQLATRILGDIMEEKKEFQIQPRRLVVVWLYTMKPINQLKKYGDIQYISRKMQYVLIYMNEENIELAMSQMKRFHFVRQVDRSYRPDVEMNFKDKIGKKGALSFDSDDGYEIEELNTLIQLREEPSECV
jgi:uncharacterized protein YlbG (UPF0298 family)